jgi:hypothetical protein
MVDSTLSVYCTACGQALSVPAADLRAVVQCPRCGMRHALESLVPRQRPLPAVVVAQPFAAPELAATALAPPSIALDATAPAPPAFAHAPPTNFTPAQPPAFTPAAPATFMPSPAPMLPAAAGLAQHPSLIESLVHGALEAVTLIADTSAHVDARLRGWRRWVLLVGAAVVQATLEWWRDGYVLALPLFALVCWGLLVSRVWSVRDDDGNWTWSYLWIRAKAATRGALQGALELGPLATWPRRLAMPLLTIGLLLVVVAEPCEAVIRRIAGQGTEIGGWANGAVAAGWIVVGVAVLSVVLAWLRGHGAKVQAAIADLDAGGKVVTFSGFAPIVDVWEVDRAALASLKGVGAVIAILKDWHPRKCEYEADYEASLLRHLRRRLPDLPIDNQRPVRDVEGRLVGRIDVVLGERLAIELKRAVRTTEADRAVGQIWKYVEHWTKGPVMLLLCETTASFAEAGMAGRIDQLRQQGKSVLVVAAGTRRAA